MTRQHMSPLQRPVQYTASPDPRAKSFLQDWADFEDSDDDTLERFLATLPDDFPKLPDSFIPQSNQRMNTSAGSQVSGNGQKSVLHETGLHMSHQNNAKEVDEKRGFRDRKEVQKKKRRKVGGVRHGCG